MGRRRIVDEAGILRILSDIALGEVGEQEVRVGERLKAVELLGKKYDLFGPVQALGEGEIKVVVDYCAPK